MALHASSGSRRSGGSPRLRAVDFTARLSALLVPPALLWAATVDGPIEWERATLVLALLRMAQDAQVSGVLASLR